MTERAVLRDPVMIAAFEGWNDAGDAATAAVEHLSLIWDAEPFAELDPEEFYDFQVTRPTVTMSDGVTRTITWPTTRITLCRLADRPHDVLLVHGIEPNFHWKAFCRELVQIVLSSDVSMVVTLGALLAEVAHTTPIQVTGSAHDEVTAQRLGIDSSDYEGPTGITGVLQDALVAAGVPSISLWAAVPHYVADPPSPKVTLALLHRIEEVLDIEVPLGALPQQADEWVTEVSRLAAKDGEISEYVRTLQERDHDAEPIRPTSGDSIAAEFERYLRRRRPGPGGAR